MTSSPSKQQFFSNLNVDGTLAPLETSEGLVRVSISGNLCIFETQSESAPSFAESICANWAGESERPLSISEFQILLMDALNETFPGIEIED
jgi:hypothetical protein